MSIVVSGKKLGFQILFDTVFTGSQNNANFVILKIAEIFVRNAVCATLSCQFGK